MDVRLDDFLAVSRAVVGDRDAGGDCGGRSAVGGGVGDVSARGERYVGVGECGVGFSVAERVPWDGRVEDVLVAEDQCVVGGDHTRVHGAAGVEVVVIARHGADVVGEGDGEFARRVVVSEEHVGEGVALLLATVELLDQRGGGVRDPGFRDRFPGREDYDGGFTGGSDGADQWGLGTDKVQRGEVNVFTGRCVVASPELILITGPGTDDYNGDVGGLGSGNSRGDLGFVG